MLLAEVSLQKTCESLAVSCFVSCHLVNCIVDSIEALLFVDVDITLIQLLADGHSYKNNYAITIPSKALRTPFRTLTGGIIMSKSIGVYQQANGCWAYRIAIKHKGKKTNIKRTTDEFGNKLSTKAEAVKARAIMLSKLHNEMTLKKSSRMTYSEVYDEYCENGRLGKAFSTIRKQDSLWRNHLDDKFGNRYIDDVSVAEINDYLAFLYYTEQRAFSYVESFLKMFYLILGQAYSRNYIHADMYSKLCLNKSSRIKMPKRKLNEDDEVVTFTTKEIKQLDEYFKGTNAETAYMLGKYCGLRISECYGLTWDDIDFESHSIKISRQMQYVDGVVALVPPKTRNAIRTLYMSQCLYDYLHELYHHNVEDTIKKSRVRKQKAILLPTNDNKFISSLSLINTLPNGKIQTVNSMKFHTKKISATLDISFKYHYLRHTYGTRLAEMNTPIFLLCNQMGHASSKVTEKYYVGLSKNGIDILVDNLNQL